MSFVRVANYLRNVAKGQLVFTLIFLVVDLGGVGRHQRGELHAVET